MEEVRAIEVDENSELFDTRGMFFKEFPSDFRQIRYFTLVIVQKAPPEFREMNLLEQQISEIIKNAIKHGNGKDPAKKIRVWYYFDLNVARVIVEDEGEGFQDLERWNYVHYKRTMCFIEQNYDEMDQYVSYRGEASDDSDGGNALFAAVEYWDGGVVFNEKRNKIALKKTFPKRMHGIEIPAVAQGAGAGT